MLELVENTSRQLLAAGLTLSYLAGCGGLWWQARQRRRPEPKRDPERSVLIAWASQSGQAEQLACQLAQTFVDAQQAAQAVPLDQLTPEYLQRCTQVILIVSTYGDGEPPDHALRFYQQLRHSQLDLSTVNYWLLGLGDRQYPDFCRFAERLDQQLQRLAANPQAPLHTLDCLSETDLQAWQSTLATHFELDFSATTTNQPPLEHLQLLKRTLLNPHSDYPGLYHLQFALPENSSWQAGDLIKLRPFNDPQQKLREYSLASVQSSGSLDLIVRLAEHQTEQGSAYGLCSNWLCTELQPLQSIEVQFSSNRNFHAPDTSTPMLLIGAGSGLAGLRGHLQQRPLSSKNWLFYGERMPTPEQPLLSELAEWKSSGRLQQLDLSFSRCSDNPQYVQQRLLEQKSQVLEWIKQQQAVIYVCGSLQGMGQGVQSALLEILGEPALQQLIEQGRYRRDLY